MVNALGDENILGHRLVDGWTRWVACAYSGSANRQTQNHKAKRGAFNGFRNFDDAKANGDRDWH